MGAGVSRASRTSLPGKQRSFDWRKLQTIATGDSDADALCSNIASRVTNGWPTEDIYIFAATHSFLHTVTRSVTISEEPVIRVSDTLVTTEPVGRVGSKHINAVGNESEIARVNRGTTELGAVFWLSIPV